VLGTDKVKFGIKVPDYPLDLILKLAKYAENSGLNSVWMVDHLVSIGVKRWDAYFPWSVLSALAMETRKVTLGTAVSDPHRLHPAVLAQAVMSVDHLSQGRVILGLGAGEAMNLDPYGIQWDHPVDRLNETVAILKALWIRESVTFQGRFFQLKNAFITPRPVSIPHPPIWIAAHSPRSMKITGQEANGWIPIASVLPPDRYREKLRFIQDVAQQDGRSMESIEPAVFIHTVIDEDRKKTRETIELPAKLMLLHWSPEVFKEYGHEVSEEFHLLKTVFNKETVEAMVRKAKELPFTPVEDRFVFGTPTDCVNGLKKYVSAGARHFILAFMVPPEKIESNLQLYVDHVIPEIE